MRLAFSEKIFKSHFSVIIFYLSHDCKEQAQCVWRKEQLQVSFEEKYMSLQFVFGPSGSGKSTKLQEEMISRAAKNPGKNFFLIVPDQFTMQTQKDLCMMSPTGGILNVDVLSFGRLRHRILEEVGGLEIPVLDDTGKCLVLQRVASGMREDLPTLGSYLGKQGYIHEVKSVLSEFMQYGIGPEDVDKLIAYSSGRGALTGKLADLKHLYQAFEEYIQGNFITTEETLDVLCRQIPKSKLLPGSVIAFDGFTGFTPIQNRVIGELMKVCDEVVVTAVMGAEEDPYANDGEQKLFYLSKKTVADLTALAGKLGVARAKDVLIFPASQGGDAPALSHLERNLFRTPMSAFPDETKEISLFETTSPKDEVHHVGLKICEMVRSEGLTYRDIAVIVGNLEAYAPYVETEFAKMEIPTFIDQTHGIAKNPLVEFIKRALALYQKDFSYDAVMGYLRSGLAQMTPEAVDAFEDYIVQMGLRGEKAYHRLFSHKTREMGEDEEMLQALNESRELFIGSLSPLSLKSKDLVKNYIEHLYDFLLQNHVEEQLRGFEVQFESEGKLSLAREYAQIYRLIMALFEQVYDLLGEEEISLDEFADILDAGFAEITVGTIPQNVDRILVGDMERTRLKQVKVLFLLGVNDGNIPKNASKGGLISDMDREFLRESELELAPSPRQQMFIQRLYLYLNMTKPSRRLVLSYSRIGSDGKSIRPAYLVQTMKRLFPSLKTELPEMQSPLHLVVTPKEGERYLADALRDFASGIPNEEKEREAILLYRAFDGEDLGVTRDILTEAAFGRVTDTTLTGAVARALYEKLKENSVTRLETFASCAYRHFLRYGLGLKEQEEFSFEAVDRGNVYHEVLEKFAGKLAENGYTWVQFPKEFAEEAISQSLEEYAASYGNMVLFANARNQYQMVRMERILARTVDVISRGLKKGSFRPESFELPFHLKECMTGEDGEETQIRLTGRIDRIDTLEEDGKLYLKVVDYKSGSRKFDAVEAYYGLQLQLIVYLKAALELERKAHPGKEIVPAALLYYHVDDPTVEAAGELSEEEVENKIAAALRMTGLVSMELGIVERLDGEIDKKSDVIPVEFTKDGKFGKYASVLDEAGFATLEQYVSKKIAALSKEILEGKIAKNPYELGGNHACKYCPFKTSCGFREGERGCKRRKLPEMDAETALRKMEEE